VRLIKMFGLAAIVVGAFMAFLGASSASATSLEEVVLCKALEDPCVNGHWGTGTILHGLATNPILLSSVAEDIECLTSHILGEITSLLAHGKITALSWLHCLQNGETCTVSNNNLPFLVKGELKSTHSGYETLVTAVAGGGRPSSLVECPGIDCNYGANTILAEVLDVSGVTVLDILQTLSGEGFCFFTSGVWHAKYEVKCLSSPTVEVNCYLAMHPNVVL
jgi:hypothetical protein